KADFLIPYYFNQLPQELKDEIEKEAMKICHYRIWSKKHSLIYKPYLDRWCAVPATKEMVVNYSKKEWTNFNHLNIFTETGNTYMYYSCNTGGYTMYIYKITMLDDRFEIISDGCNQDGLEDIY